MYLIFGKAERLKNEEEKTKIERFTIPELRFEYHITFMNLTNKQRLF